MRLELAEAIRDIAPDSLILHREYSGRGMFGKTTAGVSGSLNEFLYAIVIIARRDGSCEDACIPITISDTDMENIRTDSLGYDTIFY